MSQIKVKIESKSPVWAARKRFRITSTCKYNGAYWVNRTGKNSEPGVGNDWLKIGNESGEFEVPFEQDLIPVSQSDGTIVWEPKPTGGGSGPVVDHEYADIATMIANQNEQLEDDVIKVLDASGDPDITSGKAYYFYDGTTAGNIEDYTILTSEEVQALTAQSIIDALGYAPSAEFTATQNQYGTHPAFNSANEALQWLLANIGNASSGVTIETRTGSQVLKPSDQSKRLIAKDDAIQNYMFPETTGFSYGQNIEIKWSGNGAVKFDVAPGVLLELPFGEAKEIFGQYDYINVSPESENVWGIAGKTKGTGQETVTPTALAVSQVSTNSLYWPRVYKSSDSKWASRVTTTKDYFVLYSSDHEDPDGGVYWGEFDSFDGNILVGFVERGLIINGFQAETPELNMFPTSVTGLTDELFLSYHTSQNDPSNEVGVQETHVISLTNGELHTATQTDRGKPMGVVSGESHTGYQRVDLKDNGDYVSRFLAVTGSPGVFKYSVSSDPLDFTARTGIIDGTTGMPPGGSYIRGQIHPFEYNATKYAVIGYIAPSTERYFAIATIGENSIPNGFVKAIFKAENLRNLELFEDGDDLIILWKKGTDNTDTGYDFTMERFKKSELL